MDTLIFPLMVLIPALLCYFTCLAKEKVETLIAENYQREFNNSLKKNLTIKYQDNLATYPKKCDYYLDDIEASIMDACRKTEKRRFHGLSCDAKPAADIADGSEYYELDTGMTYKFNSLSKTWEYKKHKNVSNTGNGRLIAKKCPNCGAPLFGDHCDYCGSFFYYEA